MSRKKQHVVIDPDLHRQVKAEAANQGVMMQDIVAEALYDFFAKKPKGADTTKAIAG